MKIITPKNLSGFMELPPKEQVLFEKIKQKLEETYRLFGFYPIDTPVLASEDGEMWYRRYFAGMRDGKPETYNVGATSWSVDGNQTCVWEYMRLAEGNE